MNCAAGDRVDSLIKYSAAGSMYLNHDKSKRETQCHVNWNLTTFLNLNFFTHLDAELRKALKLISHLHDGLSKTIQSEKGRLISISNDYY